MKPRIKRKLLTGKYTVKTGAFRKRARAEGLMKELEEKGYEHFVEKPNIPGEEIWYRVAVGRFHSLKEAQKRKAEINCFVRKLKEGTQ